MARHISGNAPAGRWLWRLAGRSAAVAAGILRRAARGISITTTTTGACIGVLRTCAATFARLPERVAGVVLRSGRNGCLMSSGKRILDTYAHWLGFLSERDRAWARTRYAEVVELREAEPDRPEWFELYLGWTVAAIDSENPAAALREAIAAEDADPAEVDRALAALDRTSDEWAQWWPAWHPSTN